MVVNYVTHKDNLGSLGNAPGKWVFVPDPEEIPVTFQIGIVGSDGVLLASDRRYTRPGPVRTTFDADKIKISGNVAYCCSGDDLTQIAADDACLIWASKKTRSKESLVTSIVDSLGKLEKWNIPGSILLANDAGSHVELFRVDIYSRATCPIVCQIDNRDYQGDGFNAAAFFVERYLPANNFKQRPLEQMKLIAAHAMLMASTLNPTGVHGLDIYLCRSRRPFEKLAQSEIEGLVAASQEIDSQIGRGLGIPLKPRQAV